MSCEYTVHEGRGMEFLLMTLTQTAAADAIRKRSLDPGSSLQHTDR
jgi:hypothetical protein